MEWRYSFLQSLFNYRDRKHAHTYSHMHLCLKIHIHTLKPSHICTYMYTYIHTQGQKEKTLKTRKSESPNSYRFLLLKRNKPMTKNTRLN